MNTLARLLLFVLLSVASLGATVQLQPAPTPRFAHVDVLIDAGAEQLAAYQLEFVVEVAGGNVKLVGIEGSGGAAGAAFVEPPAYDPAALSGGRVILADYTTAQNLALPTGNVRIARLHLMIEATADARPTYAVQVLAAGNAAGGHIAATASVIEGDDR